MEHWNASQWSNTLALKPTAKFGHREQHGLHSPGSSRTIKSMYTLTTVSAESDQILLSAHKPVKTLFGGTFVQTFTPHRGRPRSFTGWTGARHAARRPETPQRAHRLFEQRGESLSATHIPSFFMMQWTICPTVSFSLRVSFTSRAKVEKKNLELMQQKNLKRPKWCKRHYKNVLTQMCAHVFGSVCLSCDWTVQKWEKIEKFCLTCEEVAWIVWCHKGHPILFLLLKLWKSNKAF